jgi:hypothetical protein
MAMMTLSETPPCLSAISPLELKSYWASVDWIFVRIRDSGSPERAIAITFWLVKTSAARAECRPRGESNGSRAGASSNRATVHAARTFLRGSDFTI